MPQGQNKKMLECAELIIQDYSDILIDKNNQSYNWIGCTLKMICYED